MLNLVHGLYRIKIAQYQGLEEYYTLCYFMIEAKPDKLGHYANKTFFVINEPFKHFEVIPKITMFISTFLDIKTISEDAKKS